MPSEWAPDGGWGASRGCVHSRVGLIHLIRALLARVRLGRLSHSAGSCPAYASLPPPPPRIGAGKPSWHSRPQIRRAGGCGGGVDEASTPETPRCLPVGPERLTRAAATQPGPLFALHPPTFRAPLDRSAGFVFRRIGRPTASELPRVCPLSGSACSCLLAPPGEDAANGIQSPAPGPGGSAGGEGLATLLPESQGKIRLPFLEDRNYAYFLF